MCPTNRQPIALHMSTPMEAYHPIEFSSREKGIGKPLLINFRVKGYRKTCA
jgi:hypothetical protein